MKGQGTSVVCGVLSASSLELIGHEWSRHVSGLRLLSTSSLELIGHERSRHVSGLWSVER